jgi:hypothetical protein
MTLNSVPLANAGRRHRTHRTVIAGLIIAFLVQPITACDVCLSLPGVPFKSDHPLALEVAMATQLEFEAGTVESNPHLRPSLTNQRYTPTRLSDLSCEHLVAQWIRMRPAGKQGAFRFTLEIMFVDAERACRLDIRFSEILTDDPRNGPADVRLITTKAGFCRLLENGFERCEQRKLIAVEAEQTRHLSDLAQLFSATTKEETATLNQKENELWRSSLNLNTSLD